MAWNIDTDSAWFKSGDDTFRHYSGVSLSKVGKLWIGTTEAGVSLPGTRTALGAVSALQKSGRSFWYFGQFGERYGRLALGKVDHCCRPVVGGKKHQVFIFRWPPLHPFPEVLKGPISRHCFEKATCFGCSAPMVRFSTRDSHHFDGDESELKTYLACPCGYAVWQMDMVAHDKAEGILRRLKPKAAGGRHSAAEIREILALQKRRCIYCNKEFNDLRPHTRDHLHAASHGGSDWALNIVLACRSCNSSRGNTPFRTYCKLLSPAQNRRILAHLKARLLALNVELVARDALAAFMYGLAAHNAKDPSYLYIQTIRPSARRNARANKLLPRSALSILKSVTRA